MRRSNTAGPCNPAYHDMLPAAERLPDARQRIDQGSYFVVHAPRLMALAAALTAEGRYAALPVSCEGGEADGDGEDTLDQGRDRPRLSAAIGRPRPARRRRHARP